MIIAGSPPSRSSASSTIDGGNLGAAPKPPRLGVELGLQPADRGAHSRPR